MASVLMRYGWDCFWYAVRWQCHQALCQFLYDHQEEEKVPIPTKIRPEDTHPLKVFEKTHVEENVYRWVVFVVVETTPECLAMVSKHSKGPPA